MAMTISKTKNYFGVVRREPGCEFCEEFFENENSRFALAYAGAAKARIISKQGGMLVLPTLGQLFSGSLLIMPQPHFETTADLPKRELDACLHLVSAFTARLYPFGKPVVFEHGARAGTGRACGIYHAHVHLVPLP